MRVIAGGWVILLCLANSSYGESPDPPLADKRLTVHTLLREDIFAGWRANDMERFARGEKNIDLLLEQRPASKAELLTWKGAAALFRAVLAHEAGNSDEFDKKFGQAREHFAEAKSLAPKHPAVAAIVGGTYVTFADRLPEKDRAAAWSECYDNYTILWDSQSPLLEKLPDHMRGELLAGMVQSTQRTGRTEEFALYLDKMIQAMPNTAYGRVAEKWKQDPQAAATANISCKMCHAEGRLGATLAAIEAKK